MGKRIDPEWKAMNLPSWSLPTCMIVAIEVEANELGTKPSKLLKHMVERYFKTEGKEMITLYGRN